MPERAEGLASARKILIALELSSSEVERLAVAELMVDCGVATAAQLQQHIEGLAHR